METRISPVAADQTPEESAAVLVRIEKTLGMVPNLHRTLAHAPAALKGYVATVQALSSGELSPAIREQIAVATAGINGCGYCASAHTMLGQHAKVPAAELMDNLVGKSSDPKVAAALAFVKQLIDRRGAIDNADLNSLRSAGFGDAEIVEITAHVGMNWFTNVFNVMAGTEIDFPEVKIPTQAGVEGASS